MTLEEIRFKYPKAHYAPDTSCRKCKGAGEFACTCHQTHLSPCACIFLHPSYRKVAVKLISQLAKRILNEVRESGSKSGQ